MVDINKTDGKQKQDRWYTKTRQMVHKNKTDGRHKQDRWQIKIRHWYYIIGKTKGACTSV